MKDSQWPASADETESAGGSAETNPGAFAVGDLLLIDGQRYDCVRLTPFWSKRQGAEIRLAVFQSQCPDCAALFEVTVKSEIPRLLKRVRNRIPRRCPFCRAAGHRVSSVLFVPANCAADAAGSVVTGLDRGELGDAPA